MTRSPFKRSSVKRSPPVKRVPKALECLVRDMCADTLPIRNMRWVSHIYIFRIYVPEVNGHLLKIGWSKNVLKRLRQLASDHKCHDAGDLSNLNVLTLIPVYGEEIEIQVHRELKAYNLDFSDRKDLPSLCNCKEFYRVSDFPVLRRRIQDNLTNRSVLRYMRSEGCRISDNPFYTHDGCVERDWNGSEIRYIQPQYV
jgi:hypothetical protein